MFRFFAGLTFAVAALGLAWAAVPPDYQSPTLKLAPARSGPTIPAQLTTTGEMLVNSEWVDLILRGARQHSEPTTPPTLERTSRRDDNRPQRISGTYKTLCVRLCDGFYFPISYSTSRERFKLDAKQCERRCPTHSRLFVYRNADQSIEDMIDLNGRSYRSLPTALLHRTRFIPNCTCRGNPWDEAEIARHRAFAEKARQEMAGDTAPKLPLTQSERDVTGRGRWARRE
jgi:hypothetical protein